MQLFASKWSVLAGGEGATFMTRRHDEHQPKVGVPARAPAAGPTWKSVPKSELSLPFHNPYILRLASGPKNAKTIYIHLN